MPTFEMLAAYWTQRELATNGLILLNLLGALLLGLLVGYERSYHGRAAGMRTYGLVCMASAALTIIGGYPDFWYGGHGGALVGVADPTRIIQGVVTGIGFLGAGVIMREGFNISGLTTAASIWASSVIGILVGVGFYLAAMGLAFMASMIMIYLHKIEAFLPSRHALAVMMRFKHDFVPLESTLRRVALERGYEIAGGTMAIGGSDGCQEWRFVVLALSRKSGMPLSMLAAELARFEGIDTFQLSHARN
ncbi:magnesium transporter MgtC [Massilia eurypsychrophila]|jgi:putative Mg2+ transporter-C (MgtC) family protein|uniref:Protein MgtC n=1 Tax=Massilia eurypsychrophila TaxID=1485217 RepID=A0A2G8TLH7_9BURK|nr:MgtC/SapB family protein [Massilia eurypsychrophila]PIL46910.1 magnesium transporter MgtC [Massilia eurypsychrophila]